MSCKRKCSAGGNVKSDIPNESDVLSNAGPSNAEPSRALADLNKAPWTCGGSIRLADFDTLVSLAPEKPTTATTKTTIDPSPIIVNWVSKDNSVNGMKFPVSTQSGTTAFEHFLTFCQPCGRKLKDQDEHEDRWLMLASGVTTNFDPYSLGIEHVIEHEMLPKRNGIKNIGFVRAELYKINVCKGSSVSSKSKIAMQPRTENQLGWLVVCLPYKHEGGDLTVNHAGNSVKYIWGKMEKSQHLHWAAFSIDCEDEVSEVTSGYRVTLTYNLYNQQRLLTTVSHAKVFKTEAKKQRRRPKTRDEGQKTETKAKKQKT